MHPYFAEYLATLQALHDELKKQAAGLPDAALDWSPGAGFNSLAVLLAHTAGAQTYWLGDVLAARPSMRDRAAEFATTQAAGERLAARLDAAMADSTAVLGTLRLESLAEVRLSPRHQREYTVAWVLHHALDHLAQHVGHAQITRQLWDREQGAV